MKSETTDNRFLFGRVVDRVIHPAALLKSKTAAVL